MSSPPYLVPCPGASAINTANFALLFQFLLRANSKANATSSGKSPPPDADAPFMIFFKFSWSCVKSIS